MSSIEYTPAPTVGAFIKHYAPGELFADWIIGPVGSGKTTGNFFKLIFMASKQAKSPVDGIRRVKAVIVRNTGPQLRDTTIPSWMIWFKDGQAGKWHATEAKFMLKFADIECEVLFRALDTPDDVARVLSLDVTFVILDEFVQIPKEVVDALAARAGRYPPDKDGGATNWGMWGASNPGNEDDWWYEALNNAELYTADAQEKLQRRNEQILMGIEPSTWTYFRQPSGFSPTAENLDKLPGGAAYYTSLAKDHSPAWVKQFIEVEWGYSLAGTPVIATFNPKLHVADTRLTPNKNLPLIGGFDPGMNSAMILGQQNNHGRLMVLDELVQRDMGAERFVSNRLRPLLRSKYPDYDFTISPDPAAAQRTPTNEKTVMDVLKRHFKVRLATTNNRLPGRIEAIEHYTCRLTEDGPALQVDPTLKHLIRSLRGGWQYAKSNRNIISIEPVKNDHSHPGDAFGYLCQHFYRDHTRDVRSRDFVPPRVASNQYHIR